MSQDSAAKKKHGAGTPPGKANNKENQTQKITFAAAENLLPDHSEKDRKRTAIAGCPFCVLL
jgi:hypothetical protein